MNGRMICRRVCVGAMVLVTAGMGARLHAEKAATRILHFPDDQFVGSLYVEDPCLGTPYLEGGRDLSLPLGLDPKRVCLGGDWDFVGLAKGDVAVPAGRNIKLMVMLRLRRRDAAQIARLRPLQYKMFAAERCCVDPNDLSGLSQLRPDDLYMLQVYSLVRTADADQRVLEPISHLTGLQILSLSKTGVTDKGMELLKKLRSLRALEFTEEQIGVKGLAVLKDLPNLEYLDCGTEPTDVGLKHLGQLPNLRWIRIRTGRMYGPGLAALANCPRLERLCIWGTSPISDRHIRCLEGLTQLKSLTLWGVCDSLTDASLASISKLKNLEELYFIRTMPRFTAAGQAYLTQLKHLRKLDLAGAPISDARYLAQLPQLESVRPVQFTADNMKALSGVRHLESLGVTLSSPPHGLIDDPLAASYLGKLTSLERFTGRFVSDEEVACLEPLSRLKELLVGGSHLTDRSLASISKLKRLEYLNFSAFGGARISRSGIKQLSSLTDLQVLDVKVGPAANGQADGASLDFSALTGLNTLVLSGCSLGDTDLASLAGLRRLEWLVLYGNFTEEGLWHLRNLSKLKYLFITGISCTSGEHLDELGGMTKLGDLHLHGRITDTALNRLSGLPSLWSLSVETDEPIRPETLARIRKAIPTLMYVHVSKPPQFRPPARMRNQRRAPATQPRVNRRTRQNRRRRR
jgi:Leucine-rich repeat (LRR) protein